ncbi:MAG TPA: ATP-binding protein [Burkholderiaceae bacterium]|jgi:signal transduction histidine kinase|nr:ATP-binding protein [Burkholderiaceae bacterium]
MEHRADSTSAAGHSPARRAVLRAGCRFALASIGASLAPAAPAQGVARRVLIVHSFGRDFAPYDAAIAAFRRELASRWPGPVVFLEAALDAGRVVDAEEESAFVAYLEARFGHPAPDLIVSSAAPAARFLTRHRAALFPGVPILLTAIDARAVPRAALAPGDTAIATVIDLPEAFSTVVRVLPRTSTIAVVLGATPLERFWRGEVERETAGLAARGIKFVWFDDLSLEQMKAQVASLPPHSAVFYGLLIVDAAGVPHERLEALAELKQASNAPIFSIFENELGRGVVGGPYLSQSRTGYTAAMAALRMLTAARSAQPVIETIGMQPPVYDWRELRRWRIDETLLPEDSEVRYREASPWARYGREIATVATVLVMQTALIAALMVQRARRRRAEREARTLGGRLITAYEDEGRRLARELHDDITQRLAGVSIEAAMLARIAEPAARSAAEAAIGSELAQLSRDVHALSYRLHPSAIDDLGLAEALRIECERAARRGGVAVDFDGDAADGADGAERGERALCLFRVAQEALRNAARHAQARHIQVRLQREPGGTAVSVTDDGIGFDASAARARASLGLASMRERVALLGGRLEIRSRSGEGTRVAAWLPAATAEQAP